MNDFEKWYEENKEALMEKKQESVKIHRLRLSKWDFLSVTELDNKFKFMVNHNVVFFVDKIRIDVLSAALDLLLEEENEISNNDERS